MHFKRNIQKLLAFKKEMEKYNHLERTGIKSILTCIIKVDNFLKLKV